MSAARTGTTRRHWPLAALAGALLLAGGCAKPDLYAWGSYEQSVRAVYATGDLPFNPQEEANRLSREVEAIADKGPKVPPGKYAHLGYLCYLNGDTTAARNYFQMEKAAYPESARFMDFMLGRLPQ